MIKISTIIDEFNRFFKGEAHIEVINNQLEITIGSQTLVVSLPAIVGIQARGSS